MRCWQSNRRQGNDSHLRATTTTDEVIIEALAWFAVIIILKKNAKYFKIILNVFKYILLYFKNKKFKQLKVKLNKHTFKNKNGTIPYSSMESPNIILLIQSFVVAIQLIAPNLGRFLSLINEQYGRSTARFYPDQLIA